MRKFILIFIGACTVGHSYGQRTIAPHGITATYAKTTALGDTVRLSNIAASDTVRMLYTHTGTGSGYVAGMNSYNDKGFAERYTRTDTSVVVIGVLAQFGGTVSSSSTKSIKLKVWNTGSVMPITSRLYYNGFPNQVLDSLTVPLTQLGIGPVKDTLKKFLFATGTQYLSGSFFVGYTVDYNYTTLNGDTISLAASTRNHRASTTDYTFSYVRNADGDTTRIDTVLNVKNATLWSDNKWRDNYTENDSLANDLAIFPIALIGNPAGTKSISSKGLTFFGAYPNPASTTTTIKVSLAAAADVSIDVMDMNGRTLQTVAQAAMSAGTHDIPVSTGNMPTGEYLYIIRTSAGDGIASKLIVQH